MKLSIWEDDKIWEHLEKSSGLTERLIKKIPSGIITFLIKNKGKVEAKSKDNNNAEYIITDKELISVYGRMKGLEKSYCPISVDASDMDWFVSEVMHDPELNKKYMPSRNNMSFYTHID